MRFEPDGVRFAPCLPEGISHLELSDLHYRGMTLEVTIHGQGQVVESMLVNGKPESLIPSTGRGKVEVLIRVGEQTGDSAQPGL